MKRALLLLIALALLLSLPALWPRLGYDAPGPVATVVDARALFARATQQGKSLIEALAELRKQGVVGVAFYEETLRDRVNRGHGLYLPGQTLAALTPKAGFFPGWYYAAVPGAEAIPLPQHRVHWRGTDWVGFPLDVADVPLGPPPELNTAHAMGFFVVYRPQNHPLRPWPPALPEGVDAYVFVGEEALGWPDRLNEAADLLKAPVALIEGTPQRGLAVLAKKLGAYRLFSLRGAYLKKLGPERAASKYVLAARERGHQLLYFRPFERPEEDARFLKTLESGLNLAHIPLGSPRLKRFTPSPWRAFAWVGVLSGLILLALAYPPRIGVLVALFLLLLAFGVGGQQAGALLSGLVFPVVGFFLGKGLWRWVWATLMSLIGAVFLAVLGSTPETVLGLSAFRGVALVLLVPPLLLALGFLPREGWRERLTALFEHRLRLGEAALALALLLAVAVVFLRRGNDAPLVPGIELVLRDFLQSLMIRPRFKEIVGHGAALLAFLEPWPAWIRNGLLLLTAVGEASILDSFAHYHTPFWISFVRSLNGVAFGVILGLLVLGLYRGLKRWLWS